MPNLYQMVLRVARHYGWTDEHVLGMPVQRFWRALDSVVEHERSLAEAADKNPLAALALMLGR